MAAYQLPLQIKLNDAATFENYRAGDNADIVKILQAATEPYLCLWSTEATGKTHLLQALCHSHGPGQAIYLPLQELVQQPSGILEGLEQFALVCLDDVQYIAARADWEEGLFHLYNRLREQGGRLCITSNVPPNQLHIKLADLLSRLNWGPVFQLQALNDQDKVQAIQLRATLRGFQLPDEVANYLLNRYPRDLHNLFAILDKLDIASLQAQRRLTIPFVKQWL
jgi:DnaA family protein